MSKNVKSNLKKGSAKEIDQQRVGGGGIDIFCILNSI